MDAHAHRQTAAARSRGRLTATLALTCGFLVVEVVGALWSGSLALLADAGHMLADAGGLALALFAIWIAGRPPTPAKTYGYYRAEILAALINALVLLVVAGGILVETYRRFLTPPAILGGPMLGVAVVGLVVNLACAGLLHGAAEGSLNVRAAYLEVLGDALSSLGVVLAAVAVVLTGWTLADPLVSGAIALVIVPRTWGLLRQAVNVLLEGTPAHLNLAEIEDAICSVAGVRRVHDLHVWTLTSEMEVASAHVMVTQGTDAHAVLDQARVLLLQHDIAHATIQVEPDDHAGCAEVDW
jgi:cobalt-zinc-cadmium efflux system protein